MAGRIPQEANVEGNAPDRLTCGRSFGRERCKSKSKRHEELGAGETVFSSPIRMNGLPPTFLPIRRALPTPELYVCGEASERPNWMTGRHALISSCGNGSVSYILGAGVV